MVEIVGCEAENLQKNGKAQSSKSVQPVIVRADTVSDSLPGLVPWIARAKNGDWIVCSFDKNDMITGAATHFVRSSDQGKTWSKPFLSMKSAMPKAQLLGMIHSLPDGNLMVSLNEVDLSGESSECLGRYQYGHTMESGGSRSAYRPCSSAWPASAGACGELRCAGNYRTRDAFTAVIQKVAVCRYSGRWTG
jgi:hypothetical protein